jgi:endonuclease III
MKEIEPVLKILGKKYPSHGVTTLNRMRDKPDAFMILISCLLSLRARDENTEIVTKNLFDVIKTPEELAKLNRARLEKLIFSSGHYHKKAEAIQHVSKQLIERFNGKVPDNYNDLTSIKHIGPKTANIVLAFAFGKQVIPVDVHCHRIPNRLGWVKTKTPEETQKELEKIIPKKYWQEFNAVFVQFGRDICNPISPKCSSCPIEKFCKKVGVTKQR